MTAEAAALLACLLSGYPQAEKCHADLVAKGPAMIKEVKPGLVAALRKDPGDGARDESNAIALTSVRGGNGGAPGEGRKRKRGAGYADRRQAEAAAEELGRLGDWKTLLALGNTTAAVGLERLENPPEPVLTALIGWIKRSDRPKDETNRRGLAAADALKRYGAKCAPVLPALIKMIDGKETRYPALTILEEMGPAAAPAVPRLAKLIKDKDWHDSAYGILKNIKTPEAERLIDDNPSWTVAP